MKARSIPCPPAPAPPSCRASIGHLGDGAENTWLVGGVAAFVRLPHGHLHVCLTDKHRPNVEVHAAGDRAGADGGRGAKLEGNGMCFFRPFYRGVDGADAESLVSLYLIVRAVQVGVGRGS